MTSRVPENLRFLLVVDLEATCWNDRPQSTSTMEVIEVGGVLVDIALAFKPLAEFEQLVRPINEPFLSNFCTELTTITQEEVDRAPTLDTASSSIDQWASGYQIDCWGSWGQYDFNQFTAEAARHRRVPAFTTCLHINLKQLYQQSRGVRRKSGLGNSLRRHGLEFEGQQHRALADARNIVRLLPQCNFQLATFTQC